jgi:hypothetical protein
MIIEFPKKYSVRKANGVDIFFATVPHESVEAFLALLAEQPWIRTVFSADDSESVGIRISNAYTVTDEQAHDALCRLCEHVMSPPVDVDMTVWGDALESEDEHGQPNQSAKP